MVDYLIKEFPDDLHSRFKSYCAFEKTDMKRKIIELITECLKVKDLEIKEKEEIKEDNSEFE